LITAVFVLSDGAIASSAAAGARDAEEAHDQKSPAVDTLLYVVPAIVVKAKRRDPDADLFNRSGFVAAVDLRERKERVDDLAAVLSQMVGVKVRQYGGLGDFATVSIRGSSASHVKVYLDGIPMNDAYTGVTNLADLPLGGVQRLEVYRGFAPPHLGSGAIGGAVNLVTTDRSRWSESGTLSDFEVYASYGSFDTSRQLVSAWLQPWKSRLFLHASHTKTMGNFPFVNDNGTPVNNLDDEVIDRANNDFESHGITGRLGVDVPGLEVASVPVKLCSIRPETSHRSRQTGNKAALLQTVGGIGYRFLLS
jgi:iron complex outermembrane receptor protein